MWIPYPAAGFRAAVSTCDHSRSHKTSIQKHQCEISPKRLQWRDIVPIHYAIHFATLPQEACIATALCHRHEVCTGYRKAHLSHSHFTDQKVCAKAQHVYSKMLRLSTDA